MNIQHLHMQKLAGLITESEYNKLVAESSLKAKIKELVHSSLGEAKKKKDEPEDVAPQEEIPAEDTLEPTDADMGMDMPTDADVDTGIDIDPKVKNVQNLLQKAYANAKALGDEKLMTQIGNTITMVVRNQVLGGQAVAESLNEADDIFDDTYQVSDEIYTRMDNLVNQPDYNAFISSAEKIMSTLVDEGFEVKDIFYYLYTRLIAEV